MWQGTGSTDKWNLSCYSPRVQAVLFGFRRFVRGGRGSTAAAVTPDTVADESRKKMADGVATSQTRPCSRGWNNCCYGDALSMTLLLACFCALLPTFRFSFPSFLFFPCIPVCLSSSCSFISAAAICYSQEVRIL